MKSETRLKEEAAEAVNRTPAVNGYCLWQCEKCGVQWKWPEDLEYDRTKDKTNWPVLCDNCLEKSLEGA